MLAYCLSVTEASVVDLLSTVGFPIVVALLCFWYIYNMQERFRDQIAQMQKEHKAEMVQMSEAINNNTLVMQKLIDKLGG